jgi:hypothetical protein
VIRRLVLCGLAAGVLAAAGCGGGQAVPDRFSGTWRIQDGRTIPIRRVERAEGERALRALGGRPCSDDAAYFRATYFGGLAQLAGCAEGDGRRMAARFDDNGRRGRIVQRLTSEHPPTFVAQVIGDAGRPFTITATKVDR